MEAEELFALPLDRFTAERNALAKQLRAAGDRDEAAQIAALKKPTVPAWAINQAARADTKAARAMLEAGDRLRDVQKRLVRGGDPAALREATTGERDAVEAALRAAVKSLDGSPALAVVERIRDTLHAVSTNPDLHDEFLAGTLSEEHRRVGFGEIPDLKLVKQPKRPAKLDERAKRKREQEDRRKADREERLAALRAELAEVEDEAADLERRARNARRRAEAMKKQIEATGRSR